MTHLKMIASDAHQFSKSYKVTLPMKILFNKTKIVAALFLVSAINVYAQGFGLGMGYFPIQDRTLGSVSISADINYDGYLGGGDYDPTNNIKRNPPGLIIGTRELARVDLSVVHNTKRQTGEAPNLKFLYYKTAAILDLRPINLGHRRGRFKSFAEEQSRSGRVRVWLDPNRTTLLLDSSDPARRRVEWPAATSLPPRHVYVEGVTCGDSGTVMMLTVLLDDTNLGPLADKLWGEKASWDAMMLSVWPSPKTKPYIDKSPVWKRL
ncbi:MAG: hypothetical protein B7Z37_11495 [Verrucomicrobia bacterium 12-59-8]|nr:MAG: hypothetical protein B7Z37_11495 [Verrucomicrobia bacterium 12-59-8]